jgi:hypothetical protein
MATTRMAVETEMITEEEEEEEAIHWRGDYLRQQRRQRCQ